jgi:hypothetical protein
MSDAAMRHLTKHDLQPKAADHPLARSTRYSGVKNAPSAHWDKNKQGHNTSFSQKRNIQSTAKRNNENSLSSSPKKTIFNFSFPLTL